MRKVAQQLAALRRVVDFGVKLHTVIAPRIVGDRRVWRTVADRHSLETFGQAGDPVAMAHPDLFVRANLPQSMEQVAILYDLDEGAAEFAVVRILDGAAELRTHRLLAVADTQNRHVHIEHGVGGARRFHFRHTRGTAGQDDRLGPEGGEAVGVHLVERVNFAINAVFPHAPCDQLRYLAAEIDNKDAVAHELLSRRTEPFPSDDRPSNIGRGNGRHS